MALGREKNCRILDSVSEITAPNPICNTAQYKNDVR